MSDGEAIYWCKHTAEISVRGGRVSGKWEGERSVRKIEFLKGTVKIPTIISLAYTLDMSKLQLTHKFQFCVSVHQLTLILPRSRTGTVWFYTSTSNNRAARPKLYTKSLTRDLKLMYSRLTLVRISIKL